jgi:hypothetical protein
MPTFPSPPLKFRTLSFPQYGFKASMSGGAFLDDSQLKPAPGIHGSSCSLLHPSQASDDERSYRGSEPAFVGASTCRCSRGLPLYPRGPWLRSELCCLGPSSLTTTPSASLAGTSRLHRSAAYTRCLRCAGAPRRPTRPSLLSLPCFPRVPSTLRRWVPHAIPFPAGVTIPGFLDLSTSRHPQHPSLPAITDGACISTLHRSLHATARAFAKPSRLASTTWCHVLTTSPSEVPCHPRFWRLPSPGDDGGQARWPNGKSTIVGTFTRQVTAASEAAR